MLRSNSVIHFHQVSNKPLLWSLKDKKYHPFFSKLLSKRFSQILGTVKSQLIGSLMKNTRSVRSKSEIRRIYVRFKKKNLKKRTKKTTFRNYQTNKPTKRKKYQKTKNIIYKHIKMPIKLKKKMKTSLSKTPKIINNKRKIDLFTKRIMKLNTLNNNQSKKTPTQK